MCVERVGAVRPLQLTFGAAHYREVCGALKGGQQCLLPLDTRNALTSISYPTQSHQGNPIPLQQSMAAGSELGLWFIKALPSLGTTGPSPPLPPQDSQKDIQRVGDRRG